MSYHDSCINNHTRVSVLESFIFSLEGFCFWGARSYAVAYVQTCLWSCLSSRWLRRAPRAASRVTAPPYQTSALQPFCLDGTVEHENTSCTSQSPLVSPDRWVFGFWTFGHISENHCGRCLWSDALQKSSWCSSAECLHAHRSITTINQFIEITCLNRSHATCQSKVIFCCCVYNCIWVVMLLKHQAWNNIQENYFFLWNCLLNL